MYRLVQRTIRIHTMIVYSLIEKQNIHSMKNDPFDNRSFSSTRLFHRMNYAI